MIKLVRPLLAAVSVNGLILFKDTPIRYVRLNTARLCVFAPDAKCLGDVRYSSIFCDDVISQMFRSLQLF